MSSMDTQSGRDIDVLTREEIMEDRLLVVIGALKCFIGDLEESIPRTDPKHANILAWKQRNLEEAKKAFEYYRNLFVHGDFKVLRAAQEIEGSCEGCMHIDCERDERPCCECSRLPGRVDRYEKEDETLADVFPELHGGKDADHET